jgi:hypothetical protein
VASWHAYFVNPVTASENPIAMPGTTQIATIASNIKPPAPPDDPAQRNVWRDVFDDEEVKTESSSDAPVESGLGLRAGQCNPPTMRCANAAFGPRDAARRWPKAYCG